MKNKFSDLLKKYTTIDEDFIDTFFNEFKIGDDLDFTIKDSHVAEYLDIKLETLRERLTNRFSKNEIYIYKVDYIKQKDGKKIVYMLNYQCFERIAMSGNTPKSEEVKIYFSKLREFLSENQNIISQAMIKKQELSKYNKFETIYFFAVNKKYDNIKKIGKSQKIYYRIS